VQFVAILLCLAAGCGRKAEPAHPPAAGRIAVMGAMTEAGRAAPVLPEPAHADSVSAVSYPSLEAARDTVEMLLRRTVDLADTAVHVSRDTVTFAYWYAKSIGRGWVVKVVVNDTSGCPVDPLESALLARGWVMAYGYSADGTDGTVLGLRSRDILCVIEGRWDGGDATDSTYVPAPGCTVTATCVPLRKDDVLR
jgi:hypothetical protein